MEQNNLQNSLDGNNNYNKENEIKSVMGDNKLLNESNMEKGEFVLNQGVSNARQGIGTVMPQNLVNPQNQSNIVSVDNKGNHDKSVTLKKNKKVFLMAGVLVCLICLISLGVYAFAFNDLSKTYKQIISQSVNKFTSFVFKQRDNSKLNFTVSTDVDVELGFLSVDEKIVDLINKTTFNLNYQFDKENKKLFFDIDSKYERDNLLDIELLIDADKEKIYLSYKEIYNKILEAELENNMLYKALFETFELSSNKNEEIDLKKALEILALEFTNIIEPKDCYKENEYLVFEIKISELMERMEKLAKSLANNDEFVKCFDESLYIRESLLDVEYDSEYYEDAGNIKMSVSLNGNDLEKFIVLVGSNEFVISFSENKVSYSLLAEGQEVLGGYFKIVVSDNTKFIEVSLKMPMIANLRLNVEIVDNGEPSIKDIKESNIKNVDDLTDDELYTILEKFEKTKLYELYEDIYENAYADMNMDDNMFNDF